MLSAAMKARTDKSLDKQLRTADLGIITVREMVTRRLAVGAKLESVKVTDYTKLRAAEQEYEEMRTSSNWVPTGNSHHPRTIRFNELKLLIANPPSTVEYRLISEDGSWSVLPKLVFDFFKMAEEMN